MTDDEFDDSDDDEDQEFAPALLDSTAMRVAVGIAAMHDPSIRAPARNQYWNGHVVLDDGENGSLLVDVGVYGMTLRIHADETHFETAPLDGGAGLAALIVARVAEYADNRQAHATELADLRKGIEGRLARERSGMTLVKVMSVAVPAEESIAGNSILMIAEIKVLDATLRRHSRWIEAWDEREAVAEIDEIAPAQRRRSEAHERLDAIGAAIEIDAVAERSIAAAGRTVAEVARELVLFHARDECDFPYQIQASGGAVGTMLTMQDGCIIAQLEVPGKVITRGGRLQLYQAIPETVAIAAVGRPATDVVDLPALRGIATITKAKVVEETHRSYFDMSIPRRPIPKADMGG